MEHMINPQLLALNVRALPYFLPEVIVAIVLILVLIVDLSKKVSERTVGIIALVGLIGVFNVLMHLWNQGTQEVLFSGMIAIDPLSTFFKFLFITTSFIVIIIAARSRELDAVPKGEFYSLILGVTLGMMLLASSHNLIMIYLALETTSMLSYCLAGCLLRNRRSAEASLKYVLYGAVASGIMIYGMALLYGLSGTMDLGGIATWVNGARDASVTNPVLFLSIIFMLAGMAYKMAAAPFHMWSPDVYEGAPIVATTFFSVGPKLAGFAVAIRFFCTAIFEKSAQATLAWPVTWDQFANLRWSMSDATLPIGFVLAAMSAVTMTIGNLSALRQENVKRLLAYSSIAHSGYALTGLVLLNGQGIVAACFYLTIYLIMNLGAFLVAIIISQSMNNETVKAYQGLVWRAPFLAIAMGIFLFSLTGVPPFAGFIGKVYLFGALVNEAQTSLSPQWTNMLYALVLIGVLNSVISLYYYARILKAMFFESPPEKRVKLELPVVFSTLLVFLTAPILLFGVWWSPLYALVAQAVLGF